MGFKFKRFNYVGGANVPGKYNWGSGSDVISRSQDVLKNMASWLITESGLHWVLDARCSSITDFINVRTKDQSGTIKEDIYPGLLFTNTTSGCKLFLSVAGDSLYRYINISRQNLMCRGSSSSDKYVSGICASIIPGGSDQEFNTTDPFGDSFLPSHATAIAGTYIKDGSNGNNQSHTYIKMNTSNVNYTYCMFANDYCIGIGGGFGSNVLPEVFPGYFIGRIFGEISHSETNTPTAKYGCFYFRTNNNESSYSNNDEFMYEAVHSNDYTSFGESFKTLSPTASTDTYVCLFDYNNTRLVNNTQPPVYNITIMPDNIYKLNSNMTNSVISEKLRWVPAAVAMSSTDLSTYYVTPGDGFKGYLDTDLFRYAISTKNNTYGNGNFIGVDYNFLVGWDPSNTETL